MNTARSDFDDTTRLISSLLDGTLPPDERARLEARLSQDAETRRLYMQMVDQEIELACLVAPDRDRTPRGVLAPVIERPGEPPVARQFHFLWWLASAAAVIALTAVFWPRDPATPAVTKATTWSADFKHGLATGWTGEIVTEGLPGGSKFGIRSVDRTVGGQITSQIQPPADWEHGLVTLTPRSTLHVTCKHAGQGGWFDVFMHTSGENAAPPQNSMFMLRHGKFPGEPGKWQTASIPFSGFVRKVPDPATGELSFIGGPPREGERVLNLTFGGSPGFELIIERMWITADGPDTETIQPLP